MALLLQTSIPLLDDRRHRHQRTIAAPIVETNLKILAHPFDGEAKIEIVVDHGGAAVFELP